MAERLLHLLNLKLNSMRTVVAEAERLMLRDHSLQCATCAKWHMTLSGAVWHVNYTIQVFCRADCRLYSSVCVVQIKASSCTED